MMEYSREEEAPATTTILDSDSGKPPDATRWRTMAYGLAEKQLAATEFDLDCFLERIRNDSNKTLELLVQKLQQYNHKIKVEKPAQTEV